jgi:hypothetical protein
MTYVVRRRGRREELPEVVDDPPDLPLDVLHDHEGEGGETDDEGPPVE